MTEIKADNPTSKKTSQATTVPVESPKIAAKSADKAGFIWGTGRRKTSVARVRIRPGEGKLLINDKELNAYFAREQDRAAVVAPLKAVNVEKTFDVFINVRGGGLTGQAGAALLGVARALKSYDESFLQILRDGGYLTRDSRMVERKKPGQSGARKRYQFSKR